MGDGFLKNIWGTIPLVAEMQSEGGAAGAAGAAAGPAVPDSDGDGLSDALEAVVGTDPNRPDTDGDGLLEGLMVGGR